MTGIFGREMKGRYCAGVIAFVAMAYLFIFPFLALAFMPLKYVAGAIISGFTLWVISSRLE